MMMQCHCGAVREYFINTELAHSKCLECNETGNWHILKHIKCKGCQKEMTIDASEDMGQQICSSCALEGQFEVQPF